MKISERLEQLPVSRFHYVLLITAGLGWMFDSMDTGIVSFILPVLMKDWHLSPEQIGNIGSIGLLGMAIGAVISGTIADRIGRKKVFAFTLLTYSIATGLCGLSWNLTSLLVFRFIVGFGLGGQLPVAVTLVSEFSPVKHRGKFLVLLESFWAFGWLLASVISYLIIPKFGWPIAFFIGFLPALYVLYLWRSIPESPRYLLSKGRIQEAEAIVLKIERECNVTSSKKLSPGTDAQQMKESVTQADQAKFAELFSAGLFRRTVFLWLLWFGIVFSYYGIFTWLPSLLALKGFSLTKSFSYVMIMTLAQIPGYFSAAYLVDKIGRKTTLALYVMGTAITAYFFGQGTTAAVILTMGSLMSFFNLGAWGIIYTYTPELYPTRTRATGSGWAAGFGRIGGILAPIVVGEMIGKFQNGAQAVFILFALVLVAVVLDVVILGEETKGQSLEELASE
ncbi:sugar phosphate permease [Desulfosporosinus acidiphilus SJ4]|uniref:Sugar phosphate permease n=1 Tax=Desulfosporosinus acidiphilus (strain DSM 22704 / JCM 16185 / SJ4) TaxID=646529 RepID=I4D2I5_DESAJ|nr:MFS transporter [Desulfosporosinus acidiphilus]AFM40009.1 sugar phosphate permease [Desulfosporosinus acidiphilus SJ4]